MRFSTSGAVRRIDLSPALHLLPVLLDEWRRLRFDARGTLVSPVDGKPVADADNTPTTLDGTSAHPDPHVTVRLLDVLDISALSGRGRILDELVEQLEDRR